MHFNNVRPLICTISRWLAFFFLKLIPSTQQFPQEIKKAEWATELADTHAETRTQQDCAHTLFLSDSQPVIFPLLRTRRTINHPDMNVVWAKVWRGKTLKILGLWRDWADTINSCCQSTARTQTHTHRQFSGTRNPLREVNVDSVAEKWLPYLNIKSVLRAGKGRKDREKRRREA